MLSTLSRAVLVAALVLTLAGPASAATLAPTFPGGLSRAYGLPLAQQITASLDRAAAYWGHAPACKRIEVIYDNSIGRAEAATVPGCTIWFSDLFAASTARDKCTVLVHGWGHLLGHDHSPAGDPDDVMTYNYDPARGTYLNTAHTCDLASVPVSAAAMVTQSPTARRARAHRAAPRRTHR